MGRIKKININTPEYWKKYTGSVYRENVRKTGVERYLEVLKHLDQDSKILDVGCNFGDFLRYMLENKIQFKSYTGFDFCETAIDEAKNEFPDHEWILGDCQSMDLERDKFDSIVTMQMLEHIEEPERFLKSIFHILKDDGQILITVPNGRRIQHESHVWQFEKEDLNNMLYAAGFRKIEIRQINGDLNLLAIATKLRKITVVTPVLCPSENVFKTLSQCFETIRKAVDKVNGEWIVVDDNSITGQEFFSKIADIYIRNNRTTGVSTSLNRGMKIGSGSFLVKLDSDYFVPENLFEVLLDDWTDDLAFISPSFTFGSPKNSKHFDMSLMPIPEGGVIDKPSGMSSTSVYQWGGGILMFDAEKLREIDYFDENFNIGSAQDNDVIYRILMKGHNWRWTNNVLTKHFASVSSTDPNAPDSRGERRRIGKEIFTKKHGFAPGGFISEVVRHFKYEETK